MNKQQTIDKVKGMQPSLVLFTQEQVVELVNSLECANNQNSISREKLQDILIEYGRKLLADIRDLSYEDCVDTSTAEFELYGNEINLTSVELHSMDIFRTIEDNLDLDAYAEEIIDEHFPISEVMELTIVEGN